jgi:hypothetical protein
MIRLRFEQPAEKAINLGWEHGNWFDYWSFVHLLTGLLLGLIAYYLELRFFQAAVVVLLLLTFYEWFEMMIDKNESIYNQLADIIVGWGGFALSYVVASWMTFPVSIVFWVSGVLLVLIIALDYFGIRDYLKRQPHQRGYHYVDVPLSAVGFAIVVLLLITWLR